MEVQFRGPRGSDVALTHNLPRSATDAVGHQYSGYGDQSVITHETPPLFSQ